MIIDFIISFVQFLNKNDYTISQEQIVRFFNLIDSLEISFVEKQDLINLMKTVFCSNQIQTEYIKQYFDEYTEIYFKEMMSKKTAEEIEEKKKQQQLTFQSSIQSKEDLLSKLDEELKQIINEIKKEVIDYDKMLSNRDKNFIKKNFNQLKSINSDNENLVTFLDAFKENDDCKAIGNIFEKESTNLVKKAEQLLFDAKLEEFELENEFYNISKRLLKKIEKENIEIRIENGTKELNKKKLSLKQEIAEEQKEHAKIMNQLNQLLKNSNIDTNSKIIKKEESVKHRDCFIGGKNFIQLDSTTQELLTKNFEKLNATKRNSIMHYIKQNLLKFKTKMTRNIQTNEKLNLNMKDTIQAACKTGGLPLSLNFDKPMKNKTNLVLVLDVSGSCSAASKMMLTFIYLLKDVFPRGCDAFAFVNSLYDISEIMNASEIESAINDVLNIIPRKGVYSNYYEPLKTLWGNYKKKITKDSIVIFMGDARNNKNDTAEEFIKNIGHRAKKCIWLNTETIEKWNKADSLASLYGKYSEMYEVINTAELISFIENF